jgi:TolB-like protein
MNRKILSLLLLFMFSTLNAQVTVVIADFENNSGEFNLDHWEKAIQDFLTSELSKSNRIVIVERKKLDKVLQEQALVLSGILDSSNVKQVGNLLNAQFIIQGTINQTNDKTRIDANIIKVKTGEIKNEKVIAPDQNHLEEMTQLLGNNIKKVLVGQGNYIEKVQLSEMPTTYFMIATAGFAVTTILLNNAYINNLNDYKNATQLSEFDSKYDDTNNMNKLKILAASATGLALAGTIYCWIRNMSSNEILALNENEINIYPNLAFSSEYNLFAGFTIVF